MKFIPNSVTLVASTSKGRIYTCDFRKPDSLRFKKGGGGFDIGFWCE